MELSYFGFYHTDLLSVVTNEEVDECGCFKIHSLTFSHTSHICYYSHSY